MITLSDVSCGFGTRSLLSQVNLSLEPGSFHFLTGPSGAGKTTLLRLCTGDLAPSGGAITLFGRNLAQISRDEQAVLRRRMGVVHQDCQFLDHLNVTQNVALPLVVAGGDLDEKARDISDLIDWVGLGAQAGSLPPELSGGERQRAALARAVIMSPEVLIADEPTGNLDWDMSLRLLRLLGELNRMGTAVLVATHDLNLIRAAKGEVPARILQIRAGTLDVASVPL